MAGGYRIIRQVHILVTTRRDERLLLSDMVCFLLSYKQNIHDKGLLPGDYKPYDAKDPPIRALGWGDYPDLGVFFA
jgi:hypothetical protein